MSFHKVKLCFKGLHPMIARNQKPRTEGGKPRAPLCKACESVRDHMQYLRKKALKHRDGTEVEARDVAVL